MLSTSRRDNGVGLVPGTDEPGDPGGVADHRPRVVVEVAAGEEISGEDLLLDDDLLAVLELDDVLHGDDDLEDPVLHVHRDDPALEVGLHLVLVAGVGVHHEPPAGPVVGALDDDGELVVLVVVVSSRAPRRRLLDHATASTSADGSTLDRGGDSDLEDLDVERRGRLGLGRSVAVGSVTAASAPSDAATDGRRGVPEVLPGLEIGIAHDLNRKMTACEKA